MPGLDPSPLADRDVVHVWHARTDEAFEDDARLARAHAWLSPAETDRYSRFRREVDRRMFALGRVMARRLVARSLGIAADWPWREGARGRPELGAVIAPPLSFNLAHSHGIVVCAISRCGEVGADVECRHRAALDRQLVRRFCAPAEAADIEAAGDEGWRDRFLRYWTLKEAYLKARGLGIAVHLSDLSFTIGDEITVAFSGSLAGTDPAWQFSLAELDGGHYVATAVGTARRPAFRLEPFPVDWLP
ncbi:MAG: 4'-phosphopantetheinyl transferase superfamily protein [Acidobacteria bacterium]|nr:4'-phosphopantetheinyl transferase superfamily protein [Acidobacteriota bacterium]